MTTKFSSLNFLRAITLAVIFVACMAIPSFAQQTVDRPGEERQSQLCSAVTLGDIEYYKNSVADFHARGILSEPRINPAYPNIRCGEGRLTLLMQALYSNNKNRREMTKVLFNELFIGGPLNETNGGGESELDVMTIMKEVISPRFIKKMRNLGAMTSCELSGECEYTGPNDSSRFTN